MTELMLEQLKEALAALTENCYHYVAASNTSPPYIIWAEDGDNDLNADNGHGEKCWTGTADLYTKQENEPLFGKIEAAFDGIGASWYFNSFQYEEETGLLHFEWIWGLV